MAVSSSPAQSLVAEKVYKPDIVNNQERLYKKPGYTM